MGVIDKAGEIVSTAAGRVGAVLSDLPDLPGVDPERLRVVIEVVWENKDLLIRLPTVLGDAGEQMQAAGAGAREVGVFLSGDVHDLTAQAADTLESLRKPLDQVGEVLNELGTVLERLPVVGNVAEPATRGLRALTEVAANIERVSVQLRGLSVSMQGAGAGLDAMGVSLQGGGVALATVSGRTISHAAETRRKAAADTYRTVDHSVGPSDDASDEAAPGRQVDQGTDTPPAPGTAPAPTPRSTAKRSTAKRSTARKPAPKKTAAKKSASKKAATKKKAASKTRAKKRSSAAEEPGSAD